MQIFVCSKEKNPGEGEISTWEELRDQNYAIREELRGLSRESGESSVRRRFGSMAIVRCRRSIGFGSTAWDNLRRDPWLGKGFAAVWQDACGMSGTS
jgi:hypothetical protein